MSEVRLPAPVKATVVDDIDEEGPAGAIEIATAGLWYVCPCGCGSHGYLAFRPAASPSWDFDRQALTLSPSVHHIGHWHGWLRQGTWVQA